MKICISAHIVAEKLAKNYSSHEIGGCSVLKTVSVVLPGLTHRKTLSCYL